MSFLQPRRTVSHPENQRLISDANVHKLRGRRKQARFASFTFFEKHPPVKSPRSSRLRKGLSLKRLPMGWREAREASAVELKLQVDGR